MSLASFPSVDLFAAGSSSLNAVLAACRPSHNRNYTFMGLLILGFFGGIGAGLTHDVLLNGLPCPLKSPIYLHVCLLMGLLGLVIYRYLDSKGERFCTRTLIYLKSFSLPWFAILGAHRALNHGLGVFGAILVGLIATTAGGVFIDLFSGVTPEILIPSKQLATSAVLAGAIYALLAEQLKASTSFFPVTIIAVLVAFVFRMFAVRQHWPSIRPSARVAGPIARA